MSTTNLNYGSSTGAPSSHAPVSSTHATGAHSGNLQLPTQPVPVKKDEALQKAIGYIKEVPNDDKTAFQSAPNIIERLQEIQGNGKSVISNSLATRVEK